MNAYFPNCLLQHPSVQMTGKSSWTTPFLSGQLHPSFDFCLVRGFILFCLNIWQSQYSYWPILEHIGSHRYRRPTTGRFWQWFNLRDSEKVCENDSMIYFLEWDLNFFEFANSTLFDYRCQVQSQDGSFWCQFQQTSLEFRQNQLKLIKIIMQIT